MQVSQVSILDASRIQNGQLNFVEYGICHNHDFYIFMANLAFE